MISRNPYMKHMKKSPSIEKYFPEGLQEPVELWQKDKVERYQTEAVAEILEHAYRNNDYYRKKFDECGVSPADFKTLEDLCKFPFLEKDELRGDPWKLLSVPKDEIAQVHMSTGTTSKQAGDHIYSIFSWHDIFVDELAVEIPLLAHVQKGDVVINALPYEMSSAGIAFHRSFQSSSGATLVNVGKGGFYSDPLKTLYVMRDLQADILITTPAYAIYLSELAEENGMEIQKEIKLRYIWLTGEGCSDSYRKRIESVYNCPALMYYGSLEGGILGIECMEQNGYHMPDGHVFIEVVHPKTGKRLPDGMLGELCITTLYRRAMPLIRYRVQDLGFIETSPCPCCLERSRVMLRGREIDQIRIGKKGYSPFYLEELLYRIPEVGNSYQFLVSKTGLSVHLELKKGVEASEKLKDKIRNRMSYYIGNVEDIVFVDAMPRTGGKTKRVVYVD